jgi:SAM-dependent methyltransferase
MQSEFDTVASWTEQAVRELGPEYALVAGCRGSGSPSGLTWLCESLRLEDGVPLLDAGAGVGGPAAFAAERYGAAPVLAEPMLGACVAARRLFGFPTVAAWSQQLPFGDDAFQVAWCLGVLCTTTAKAELLAELRRVLVPSGRLGLLVLVRTATDLPEQPEGNSFPSEEELAQLLEDAGFLAVEQVDAGDMPPAPLAWQTRVDRVEEVVAQAHADDERFRQAQEQSAVMGRLLGGGHLRTLLISAVAT